MSTTNILYACSKCRKFLGNITGIGVVNEVGRKECYGCGDNRDNLEIFGETELKEKIGVYNKKFFAIKEKDRVQGEVDCQQSEQKVSNFIEANTFDELGAEEQEALEGFFGGEDFEKLRNELSVFSDMECFDWIKKGTRRLPIKLKFFILGYHFSREPNLLMKYLKKV